MGGFILDKYFLLLAFMVWLVLGQVMPAEGIEKIIRVAGDNQYPPYEFLDINGNYRGFNIDVITAIAIEKGITLEFHPMDWQEAQVALLKGEVDVIQGMTYSDRRNDLYLFAEPIVVNAQAIFVPDSVRTISTLEDLIGKKVAVQEGDIAAERVRQIEGINILIFADQEEAVRALINGKADAFVGNQLTGWYLLEKWHQVDNFKEVGFTFAETRYGPVVNKGDQETVKILNDGLKTIKSNGTYDKIYHKWFGRSYISNERYLKLFSAGIMIIGLLALIGGFIFNNINQSLKRLVKERTRELESYANWQEAILYNSPNGILTMNAQGVVTTSNPSANRMLGMEAVGKHYGDIPVLSFLNQEQLEKTISTRYPIQKIIQYKKQVFDVSVKPVIEEEDTVNGLLINLDDISAERELVHKNIQEAKVKTLATLTAGIAHEIRNPLTSIKTYIDLLPAKIENQVFQNRILEVIPKEISRIEQLINELIDYARPRQAKPELLVCKDVLEPVVELIRAKCEEKGVFFRTNLKGSIYCDEGHLKQIVLNLLLNSHKATDSGGKIVLISVPVDKWTKIIVADNGHGIPPEYLDQVFDPFFSLKGGSGLGLALVQQMVGENNGFVRVISKHSKGVRFEVWLNGGEERIAYGTDN